MWAVVSMFALGFTFASLVLVRGGWSLVDDCEFRPFLRMTTGVGIVVSIPAFSTEGGG